MVIIHMVAERKMRNTILKYSLLISISTFVLFSFTPSIFADNYGEGIYGYYKYSDDIPSNTSGTTKAYRDKFLAEQRALALQQLTPTTTPTTPTPTTLNITRTLKQGMKGDDVKELQNYLNTHEYNCGAVDGGFGPKTKAKVILFQKANGLTPDGIVGPKTISLMNQVSNSNPDVTPLNPTPTTINITRTLKQGMKGDDVKELQNYLNTHEYNCGAVDGAFGPKTKAKVILFQKANGLTPDGIVGPKTKEVMK